MIYGLDVASFEGDPDWAAVKQAGISFAFSKVTQGLAYTNPTWGHNKAGMLALGSDFLPGSYHFLQQGEDPAAQARYFVSQHGGHLDQFAVALDVEVDGNSHPTAAEARAWVAEFKRLTGGHAVGGYWPKWYWEQEGQPDLSFFDYLWQSEYVSGSGSPAGLFSHVPSSWWDNFGNGHVKILQFTDSASVSGVSGGVDANAFNGTVADLRALALGGGSPTPTPAVEEDMQFGQLNNGPQAITPISLPQGKYSAVGFVADNGLASAAAPKLRVAVHVGVDNWQIHEVTVDSTKAKTVVVFSEKALTDGISVRREDDGAVPVAYDLS